jgi:hypothetical protein
MTERQERLIGGIDAAYLVQIVVTRAYGDFRDAAARLAKDSGASERAAQNWMQGKGPMTMRHFINAYRNNERFAAWARRVLLVEPSHDPEFDALLGTFIKYCAKRARTGGNGGDDTPPASGEIFDPNGTNREDDG